MEDVFAETEFSFQSHFSAPMLMSCGPIYLKHQSLSPLNEQYPAINIGGMYVLREESSQTNVILQYKLLVAIVSAVCSVIQQS